MIAEEISNQVVVRSVSFTGILLDPDAAKLIRAYAAECLVPNAEPQPAIYEAMEKAGGLKCFVACIDGALVGFCSVIMAIAPHDGHLVATTESLFVDPAYRHTSAFEDLFSAAEHYATEAGCRVLSCGARIGSALDVVLSRRPGFSPTHIQHTKWLGDWRPESC